MTLISADISILLKFIVFKRAFVHCEKTTDPSHEQEDNRTAQVSDKTPMHGHYFVVCILSELWIHISFCIEVREHFVWKTRSVLDVDTSLSRNTKLLLIMPGMHYQICGGNFRTLLLRHETSFLAADLPYKVAQVVFFPGQVVKVFDFNLQSCETFGILELGIWQVVVLKVGV